MLQYCPGKQIINATVSQVELLLMVDRYYRKELRVHYFMLSISTKSGMKVNYYDYY